MGQGERERKGTDQDMSEAVRHGTILVVFGNDILTAAVEISEAACCHRWTVLTGRSVRVVAGDSSETDWENAVLRHHRSRWRSKRTYIYDRVCFEPISKHLCEGVGLERRGEHLMGRGGRDGPVEAGTWWESTRERERTGRRACRQRRVF